MVEERLKTLIIERYGNLKAFVVKIDMPWTTLDSILKRGVRKANVANIIKIAEELDIDVESLANGAIKEKGSSSTELSSAEERLLSLYRELTNEGREKVLEYASDLAENPRYIKRGDSATIKLDKEA